MCEAYYTLTLEPMSHKDKIKFGGTQKVWNAGICKELGRLTQCFKNTAGTDTRFFSHMKKLQKVQNITSLHTRKLW